MQLYRAKAERKCCRCPAKIKAGETYYGYRERATSSAEARNAGSLYVKRVLCNACADERLRKARRLAANMRPASADGKALGR